MNWEISNRITQAELRELRRSIEIMSSTVNAGLAALQQADNDLAAAVTANADATQNVLAEIKTMVAQLANNEDPAVQTIASDIETKIATLQASTAALTAVVAPPVAAPTEPAPVDPAPAEPAS